MGLVIWLEIFGNLLELYWIFFLNLFCRVAISFTGVGDLSPPPWCVLRMLCNTTHVKTISLTTFGFAPLFPVVP